MIFKQYTGVVMSAALAATVWIAPASNAAAQGLRTVTLDAGTVIPVKLRDTLSSLDSHKGDRFTATLQSEDSARSLNLPVGTTIEGTVAAARAKQGQEPGVLALNFDRVVLPNESSYPIHGALIGLDDKSVTRGSNGRLVAKADHKNKTLLYAGYGAGAGLILGAITKGNTILDTLLGGGLGYLLGSLDKSHGDPRDVNLKPNTELGVRLDQSVRVKVYDEGTGRYDGDTNRDRQNPNYRNGDRTDSRDDPNRDPYDDNRPDNRPAAGREPYDVLNQYTDIEDNGQPFRVVIDRRPLSFLSSARPYVSGGVLMVPAVPALKAADERYSYTASQFTVHGADETFTGRYGSRIVTGSDSHRYTLPAAIQRRNGTTYVPVQFLALVTGKRLSFDRDNQTMELADSFRDTSIRRGR